MVTLGLFDIKQEDTLDNFPFDLADIKSWIIRKKDGTAVRYNIVRPDEFAKTNTRGQTSTSGQTNWRPSGPAWQTGGSTSHFSRWCAHAPNPAKDEPIYEADGVRLFIADAPGAKQVHHLFDVAIDGGHVLSVLGEYDSPTLYGDELLSGKLAKFVSTPAKAKLVHTGGVRILKIDWLDRHAPPLLPQFWPALLSQLKALAVKKGSPLNVLTICQGGHGRSGSALACLIMCLTDYSPLDVLTHVRALHCARAIESKEQHEYLNAVGVHLGRKVDALEAGEVKSFKDRFLTLSSPFATPYLERVKGGKGASVSERESSFL